MLWKTRKSTRKFHLYCWDHVCKVNEVFSQLFPSQIFCFYTNDGTRLMHREMQKVFRLRWPFNGPSGQFSAIKNI